MTLGAEEKRKKDKEESVECSLRYRSVVCCDSRSQVRHRVAVEELTVCRSVARSNGNTPRRHGAHEIFHNKLSDDACVIRE